MKYIKRMLILLLMISPIFYGCEKDATIPLRTVDVIAYGENNFNLGVRMASWNSDSWMEAMYQDSTTVRLTYVQTPDTLKIKSEGNRVIVYSNSVLLLDTTYISPISLNVPII